MEINNILIEGIGKINFNVDDITKKHVSQSDWKRIALIETYDDLAEYYSWFLKTRFNLFLNKPLRGSHISFINDRDKDVPNFEQIKKLFHNKEIKFYYDINPKSNGQHWWLRIFSPDSQSIRTLCGGNPDPYFPLHLSLGYANEKNIEHSNYIMRQCIKFNLSNNEKRKDFNEYDIIYLK